jgi:hypothetical protein
MVALPSRRRWCISKSQIAMNIAHTTPMSVLGRWNGKCCVCNICVLNAHLWHTHLCAKEKTATELKGTSSSPSCQTSDQCTGGQRKAQKQQHIPGMCDGSWAVLVCLCMYACMSCGRHVFRIRRCVVHDAPVYCKAAAATFCRCASLAVVIVCIEQVNLYYP